MMKNWDDLKIFLAIARLRTHRKAAIELGLDQATVGRRLHNLEASLGVKLLERHSEGYLLTEMGKRIFDDLKKIEIEFDTIGRALRGGDERMEGLIRVAAPGAMANHFLIPRLREFLLKYPKVTLEFLTGPEVVNLAKREADFAVRLVRPRQIGLQLKKVGTLVLGLYAHRDLLNRLAFKGNLESLPFVALDPDAMSELEFKLLKDLKVKFRHTLLTRAWSCVYAGVQSGVGAGILPSFMVGRESSLIHLSKGIQATCPVWIAYHSDLRANARIRALVAEIGEIFKA